MKRIISELKIFIFGFLYVLTIQLGVAQNNSPSSLVQKDSLKIENDRILKTPFGVFNLSKTTGAVFSISGEELRQTAGDNLSEALRGRVPGLRIIKSSSISGSEAYTYVLNGGTPYILIDGQPRGLQVDLREVEEVLVLSDGTFNSLMGNLGDNGLIYVITKGGKPTKFNIEVNYQGAVNMPTKMPDLLSAAEYAKVINQASTNDGFGTVYSQEAINAYENGSDPIKYPNVDYQDEFVSDLAVSQYGSIGIYGGNEKTSYSAFLGFTGYEGLESVGTTKGKDINFRTKINTKVNDLLNVRASVYGKFTENERAVLGPNTVFSWISNVPANAFPLQVGDSAYVVNNQYSNNLLAELEAGGIRTDYTANLVFDLGLDFDLEDYVPGLKYSTYLMMRTFDAQSLISNNTPGLYTLEYLQDQQGLDSLSVRSHTSNSVQIGVSRSNTNFLTTISYGGNLSYAKNINETDVLNLNLSHLLYYQPNNAASAPDNRNITVNLNGSYSLKDKYIMFANANMSSSSKFINSNRTSFYPTVGLAWVASNENFLKDNDIFDFVKLRASYGQIGTEYTASTFYYLDTWGGGSNNGTIYLGTSNTPQGKYGFRLANVANEDIDWVVYNQFYSGIELKMLKKLDISFNYFNILIDGQLTKASALYADALGNDTYLPMLNFKKRRNKGFNANLTFSETEKPFKYRVGFNAGYNKIIGEKIDEVPYPDQYRLAEGQPEDRIMGYVSDGLFTAENIGDALPQFGEVQVGDIRYVDQNNDNVIDARDQRAIGNNTPRFNYGINVGFKYKGLNLDVVGMGVADYDINLNSYSYYKHYGLATYHGSVNSDLPNGNQNPRLSTLQSVNNYRNSDYWIVDGSFFRISNLELGYTLPKSVMSKTPIKDVKLFLRGSNLAVFSKLKDLDPEDPAAGLSEYPMMRSFVIGATMNF
ncbi:SusC/RagA family TonB-linked outer membrane protein [Polaribacter vadi]|uniref:SusC/RagA family TonB-linked outer membrane protein n=1 Tax=Polaribacter TaxID=52959 RepID=UPI001C08F754|nr:MULTISPECIES: SusC/RagA family TonB-linked outer membrane protein [Polaribacter]MBU3011290.1 SusC/RagA family TonB-linked outer membrane protein [Polaribacter vadi]MDO6741103.1 SusC/RagA family TonB-linked outer membrane protein [Polaribacter sp. 1_MG-2023]